MGWPLKRKSRFCHSLTQFLPTFIFKPLENFRKPLAFSCSQWVQKKIFGGNWVTLNKLFGPCFIHGEENGEKTDNGTKGNIIL